MTDLIKEMTDKYPIKGDKQYFSIKSGDACSTPTKKWNASLLAGVIFFIIASPFIFKLTNGLMEKATGKQDFVCDTNGCPSIAGLALHTVVFILITRILMK